MCTGLINFYYYYYLSTELFYDQTDSMFKGAHKKCVMHKCLCTEFLVNAYFDSSKCNEINIHFLTCSNGSNEWNIARVTFLIGLQSDTIYSGMLVAVAENF